ncbi:MAG: glycosyltransferase [Candidatus Omnitrophica bacterium]|nr:glycosyltransferase [Candidatus Omnitrophota bacterium]
MNMQQDLRGIKIDFLSGTLERGGAERQLWYMTRVCVQAKMRVRVLTLNRGGPYERMLRDEGVPVLWVGQPRSRFHRLWSIIRQTRAHRPHCIHSAHFYSNLYAVCAARLCGAADIGAIRTDVVHEVSTMPFLGRAGVHLPRYLVANSAQAIETLRARGLRKRSLFLLENGVDTEKFSPAEPNDDDPRAQTEICFVCAGSCASQKRIDLFLSALTQVRKSGYPRVRGIVAGDGPLRGVLQRQARELGLGEDAVQFLGEVGDIQEVYRKADVCVLTSDYEGMPNVVLEAMACGLPVVATAVGAVPDLLTDSVNGYVVERGNVTMLADRLRRLVQDPRLCREMGQRARSSVKTRFSLAALSARAISLYTSILAREGSRGRSWPALRR